MYVSVCRGDVLEDYRDQEIECFMEEVGFYDGEMDDSDPRMVYFLRYSCSCSSHKAENGRVSHFFELWAVNYLTEGTQHQI